MGCLRVGRGGPARCISRSRQSPCESSQRDLHALVRGSETEVVDSVVWNRERMKVDLADTKIFARLDLLDAIAQSLHASTRLFVSNVDLLADVSVESLA